MKKFHRFASLFMALAMIFALATTAFAADSNPTLIDTTKKASLNIYKYDLTKATAGGCDTSSYVATGAYDASVNTALASYAVQGVKFTYLKVADITTYTGVVSSAHTSQIQYGFSSAGAGVLTALGLKAEDAVRSAGGVNYYTSEKLNKALADKLTADPTGTKNALETAVSSGTVMAETNASGNASATDLAQGLYLVVETAVPDNVVSTCNPFFVSLPMTNAAGTAWNYDVTVYPKNATGDPTLEKTVREAKADTGKNNGSVVITDGFAHTGTASAGDTVEYQIISHLPSITSAASYLTCYTYVDTLSKGIAYTKGDIKIQFFTDSACATDAVATWNEESGKFTVAYDTTNNKMTITMSSTGLAEINTSTAVYSDKVHSGYSDCYMRITYTGKVCGSPTTIYGDAGNANEVVLTWARTNTTYSKTLKDCCHIYTYGMDLLKTFADNKGNATKVQFKIHNDTDNYYVKAELKDGVYYVTGHETDKTKATVFSPIASGHLIVKGLEDDTYTITEIQTDKGYLLLKEDIKMKITSAESSSACTTCGKKLLTASAKVNDAAVTMTGSNAIVPLTVVNNPGFELPKTGGYGNWMFPAAGAVMIAAAVVLIATGKKKSGQTE